MRFVKVPKSKGEETRRELIQQGLLSNDYAIFSEGDFIFMPVKTAKKEWGGFEIVEKKAERRPKSVTTLKDALAPLMDEKELESLTTSFDLIGDLAIVEIPPELEPKEKEIGEALLKVHKNVRTVLKKLGPMEGEFRVRKLGCIAGEDRTETTYRESGLRMRLDVAKVYFSVRLSHERKRISELVKDGEKILVLFAGVGPFALVIAKNKPKTRITAVELNPEAVRYMRENIELNKIKNIEPMEADARDFKGTGFDRVLMPLPKGAEDFLDVAFNAVKDGGVIHFYTFADSRTPFEEAVKKVKRAADKAGVSIKVLLQRVVRPFSPKTVQVVLDISIGKTQ